MSLDDSIRVGRPSHALPPALAPALAVPNALGVVVAAVYAGVGMRSAWRTDGSVAGSESTYRATASTMRAVAIAAPLVPGLLRGTPSAGLLVAAGLVQLGDALIGVRRRNAMMATFPALMGAVHLTSAVLIRRRSSR